MADVDNSAWDAGKAWSAGSNSDDPASFFKGICAGEKSDGDPATQAHWALPHHYHPGDAPNASGVRNGLSRIGQTDGLKNKSAAQAHLDAHMKVIQAAENRKSNGASLPGGQARMRGFASQLRSQVVQRDGKNFFQVEGYATLFNKPYQMYDMFGEYTEKIDSHALDQSLAGSPDVAFLLNHRGMTMARTTNGTLQLSKDINGLKVNALLNADRADVRDMVSAINDGLIDEMSFAFMIGEEGFQWNDDYSALTLTQIDIDRGDVSAVNYGANPYTSIATRAAELIELTDLMPIGLARAAALKLRERFDFTQWEIPGETRAADDGPSNEDLVSAIDAALDGATAAFANADTSNFDPDIQQAIGLVNSAGTTVDNLMSAMGIPDPDNDDSDGNTDELSASGLLTERVKTGSAAKCMATDLLAKRFQALDI